MSHKWKSYSYGWQCEHCGTSGGTATAPHSTLSCSIGTGPTEVAHAERVRLVKLGIEAAAKVCRGYRTDYGAEYGEGLKNGARWCAEEIDALDAAEVLGRDK